MRLNKQRHLRVLHSLILFLSLMGSLAWSQTEIETTFALPTNAQEATEFAKAIRKRFDSEAEKEGLSSHNSDPSKSPLVLLIKYSDPAVASNIYVQEALTKLNRKGYKVRVERDTSNDEAIQAILLLEKQADAITETIIGNIQARDPSHIPQAVKYSAKQKFRHALDELKIYFGLRRGITFYSFVKPFIDDKTGIRNPLAKKWDTFKTQFPLIVTSCVSAFYGALFIPEVVQVMGAPNFFDWTYQATYWTLHSSLTGAGHSLPVDPAYFAVGATLTRLFWAFFDPAADANMRHGSRFNVYTNRTNIPYQYQMLSQFAHSFPGDLFITVCGYELSRIMTGVTVSYSHLLYTVVPLVSLSGSLAKNLPKSILFQMMDSKIIDDRGQNRGNTIIGLVLSYMKTMKVVHSGSPLDPYYWFSYLGVLYAAHTSALNKYETYRIFFRETENTLSRLATVAQKVASPLVSKAIIHSSTINSCANRLSLLF